MSTARQYGTALGLGERTFAHMVTCVERRADVRMRDAMLGFNDSANLDDGTMWPTAFALTELTAANGARMSALAKRAVS